MDIGRVKQNHQSWREFQQLSMETATESDIRAALDRVTAGYQWLMFGAEPKDLWYRARKVDQGRRSFDHLAELSCPPFPSLSYGRAHVIGGRTVYAAQNAPTALDEIGAEVGDVVQMICFRLRLRPGVRQVVHAVGQWLSSYATRHPSFHNPALQAHIMNEARRSIDDYQLYSYVDSIVASMFRASIDKERPWEYKPTAVYSKRFIDQRSSVIYPSVQNPLGINIAIPADVFDLDYEILATQVLSVDDKYGFGFYQTSNLRGTNVFEPSGEICWDRRLTNDPSSFDPVTGVSFDRDHRGWMKPA